MKFSSYHAKKSLPVYLYINLLFQIITSLWGRSALDNLSEFELLTIVITATCYNITPENSDSISWYGTRNKESKKKINDRKILFEVKTD